MGAPVERPDSLYFSLAIPEEDTELTHDKSFVFSSLKELQPILQRNIHARFAQFSKHEDAVKYISSPIHSEFRSAKKVQSSINGRFLRSRKEESDKEDFPTPTPQELASLNNYFSRPGHTNIADVEQLLEKNPRILCTDCDIAPAVHVGTKQNALHVAAKCNYLKAAECVLKKISDISFYEQLNPNDNPIISRERCKILNISYLNTPDKYLLETPLHFAAKFYSMDVLKLLISHPLCDLEPKNQKDRTPADEACTRCEENREEKRNEVIELLNKVYVVPIWRDVGTSAPHVGMYGNWRSFGRKLPKIIRGIFSNLPEEILPPLNQSLLPLSRTSEETNISSYAGPMSKEKAIEFHRLLKESSGRKISKTFKSLSTPLLLCLPTRDEGNTSPLSFPGNELYSPKDLVFPYTPPKSISFQSLTDMNLRMEDSVKGLERLGRKYAKELDIPWTEYWGFLNTFANLQTPEGLELLESFLLDKVFIDGDQPKENDIQVFYAVKDIFVISNEMLNKYPAIARWYYSLETTSKQKTLLGNNFNFFHKDALTYR